MLPVKQVLQKVGGTSRKGSKVAQQNVRALCTTRKLLKPKPNELAEAASLDDEIRQAAEQLANLRKARATMKAQERLKTEEDTDVQKFLQSQLDRQSGSGAESGMGLASITSFSEVSTDTVAEQTVRAWDGCTACTHVAYAFSDDAFIFPITPSSPMAEIAEAWSVAGIKNVFGGRLNVQQLQSEAGAAGSLHGSVAAGGLGTTFTSSQGLLLMLPNMYKIAGELLPCVIHVAARAIAGSALSIFGDHQDVMAVRAAGWGMLSSQGVQDCQDLAIVAHLATLRARVPIIHFQDGFRTSHEINSIESLSTDAMRDLIDHDALRAQRARGLSALAPTIRGSNQNPDVYMQSMESANTYYEALAGIVEECMEEVSQVTGRPLSPFRYSGDDEPEHIIMMMGSAAKVTESVVPLLQGRGEKVGVLSPLLFRPWPSDILLKHLPSSVKTITVLDRTKENGAFREPLFLDVAATLQGDPRFAGITLLGGRYGLGSKEYCPHHAMSVFENAIGPRKDRFTVGINDDVTFTSLPAPSVLNDACVPASMTQCVFLGLAGDGTVGANKNAVKIIGDNSDLKAQAYFYYSSVKAGTPTVSHMRFGPEGTEAPYLTIPNTASYVACSFTGLIDSLDVMKYAKPGATFVLNCSWSALEDLETNLPTAMKKAIAEKNIKFYTIDASKVAQDSGLGKLTNNVMQTAFFNLSNVLPIEEAMGYFQDAIQKTYKKHGDAVIDRNLKAVESSIENLFSIEYPAAKWATLPDEPLPEANKYKDGDIFTQTTQAKMVMQMGDELPVSAFPPGGGTPMGLSHYEKKAQATHVPEVDMDKCTQCNYCAITCPHAVIRPFLLDQNQYDSAPETLEARKATSGEQAGFFYRIQVSNADCTGCEVCVKVCPDDALAMVSQEEAISEYGHPQNWEYLRNLPVQEDLMKVNTVKGSQMQQPLMEFSAACLGCGETPYIKLLTQMFGERMVIANATGCSSIYGNPYGSTPYTVRDSTGKGAAWHNSLFEDNAEFGFGMAQNRLARRDRLHNSVGELLKTSEIDAVPELRGRLLQWYEKWQSASTCNMLQDTLPALLEKAKDHGASSLHFYEVYDAKDAFLKTSQWIIGGDGWAYDIGFGGLDHVIASGSNVNFLVLDTEGYSNTGGQKSKSTPGGSIAKFAMGGKERQKKSLTEIGMTYENVYVASCALGANMTQTTKAFAEAEEYDGPSLILAYSPCIEFKIAHQDGLGEMLHCQRLAVSSGYWPLFRFDPRKELPMQLDQKKLREDLSLYLQSENRFNALLRSNPESFKRLTDEMRTMIRRRHNKYLDMGTSKDTSAGPALSILYGSETGNTAELAARFAGMCKSRGYSTEVAELNDLSVEDLADKKDVMIMIATCGEGQIPQNAITLYEDLGRAEPGALEGVNYSLFALGDKAYHKFCSAGYDYDTKLQELGAIRQMPAIGIGDDKDEDKFETGFDQFLPEWLSTVQAPPDPKENEPPAPLFELVPVEARDALASISRPPRTQTLPLTFNKRISPADYAYSIRHIMVDDQHNQLPYLLGDALSVNWTNDETRAREFLTAYGIDADQCYVANPLPGVEAGVKAERLDGPFKVVDLFTDMLDLFGRPSKNFLKQLSKIAPPGEDKDHLQFLLSDAGKDAFTKEIFNESMDFAEVLLKFPSAKPDLNQLITMLPGIKPRLYTIASSTRRTPGKIELTIITNDWETSSGKYKCGSCTDFFERIDTDKNTGNIKVDCSITPGSFQFGDPEVPMVMTGTGTGVAPFLAFAKEREWFMDKFGPERCGEMWLFFGCRNKTQDYILGDELEALEKKGVLTHLRPAFSRDGPKKVYIQDKIKEEAKGVKNALVDKQGYLYLCGQAGDREKDVLDAVTKAFELAGMSAADAKEAMDTLVADGRYCPELY